MSEKLISLQKYKREKFLKKINQKRKMLFFVIVVAAFVGAVVWDNYVENVDSLNVQIPESKNLVFNNEKPVALTTAQIANYFENADGKPILLYIYTTWCKVCSKNFPVINEISREFQNTDLQVITLAIDRRITPEELSSYLKNFGDIYFQPNFLAFKDGFLEFLEKQQISYSGKIPFTVLINRDGHVVTKFVGTKSRKFLRNKVIQILF